MKSFYKKDLCVTFWRGRITLKWKERKVMRLLNIEWFMLVLLLKTCLCWENSLCEQPASTRSWKRWQTGTYFSSSWWASAHLSRFKNPVALSIFIDLIPPTKPHQQSPRYVLRVKKAWRMTQNMHFHNKPIKISIFCCRTSRTKQHVLTFTVQKSHDSRRIIVTMEAMKRPLSMSQSK